MHAGAVQSSAFQLEQGGRERASRGSANWIPGKQ